MKRIAKRILSLFTALAICFMLLPAQTAVAQEAVYYVSDTTGSDSNQGTQAAHLKTLNKALALACGGSKRMGTECIMLGSGRRRCQR